MARDGEADIGAGESPPVSAMRALTQRQDPRHRSRSGMRELLAHDAVRTGASVDRPEQRVEPAGTRQERRGLQRFPWTGRTYDDQAVQVEADRGCGWRIERAGRVDDGDESPTPERRELAERQAELTTGQRPGQFDEPVPQTKPELWVHIAAISLSLRDASG
jgi:hypothetical protein